MCTKLSHSALRLKSRHQQGPFGAMQPAVRTGTRKAIEHKLSTRPGKKKQVMHIAPPSFFWLLHLVPWRLFTSTGLENQHKNHSLRRLCVSTSYVWRKYNPEKEPDGIFGITTCSLPVPVASFTPYNHPLTH